MPTTFDRPDALRQETVAVQDIVIPLGREPGATAHGGQAEAFSTLQKTKPRLDLSRGFEDKALGGDLLLHRLSDTTIGAAAFHFCVREGNRWDHCAMAAKETAGDAQLRVLA